MPSNLTLMRTRLKASGRGHWLPSPQHSVADLVLSGRASIHQWDPVLQLIGISDGCYVDPPKSTRWAERRLPVPLDPALLTCKTRNLSSIPSNLKSPVPVSKLSLCYFIHTGERHIYTWHTYLNMPQILWNHNQFLDKDKHNERYYKNL